MEANQGDDVYFDVSEVLSRLGSRSASESVFSLINLKIASKDGGPFKFNVGGVDHVFFWQEGSMRFKVNIQDPGVLGFNVDFFFEDKTVFLPLNTGKDGDCYVLKIANEGKYLFNMKTSFLILSLSCSFS